MKNTIKITSIVLIILLMLQMIFPIITNIEMSISHAVTIPSINDTTAILVNKNSTHETIFSGIGRYKFNYTGASSRYIDTNPTRVDSGGYSKLGLNGIESDHDDNHKANSSGAKLTITPGSSVKKAYLVMQYNEHDNNDIGKVKDYYVTLSYNSTKGISNFTPSESIKFKPTKILYNPNGANFSGFAGAMAYIEVTDFIEKNGTGYYYCSNIPSNKKVGVIDVQNKPGSLQEGHNKNQEGETSNGTYSKDISAAWKIIVIEQNKDNPLKALKLNICYDSVNNSDGTSYSKNIDISLPSGIKTKSSSQAKLDIIYGIFGSDAEKGSNKIQYKIGNGSWTNPQVSYNGYTIRSDNYAVRMLYTINGKPIEQITNYPTPWYIEKSSLTNDAPVTLFTKTPNEFPITGDDTELITDIGIVGGESKLLARISATKVGVCLNTIGIAADIEGFNYSSTQTTTLNNGTSVTVTGRSTNTTTTPNIGISNGTYTVKLDSKLTASSATATIYNNGTTSTISGTINNTNHTVTFSGVSTLTKDTYIDYTIYCSIDAISYAGKTIRNEANYSGYYYNNSEMTDYIEDATVASSNATVPYYLTINPNGGTWSNSTSNQNFSMNYGATKTIAVPTRTGYTFTGWTLAGTGSTMSSLTANNATFTMGTANATLTANWRINTSTLKVNPNGGSWEGSTAEQSFTQNYNTTKSIPIPTRTGYTFTGWTKTGTNGSLSSTTSIATYTFGAGNNVTDTITANWKKNNYNLQVRPNGGTWNNSSNNQDFKIDYQGTKSIALPIRNGYTFTGWTLEGTESTMSSLTANNATFTMGSANATLIANWRVNTYNLTVNPNGGNWDGNTANQNYTINYQGTQIITVPTRNSYNFTKWELVGDGSQLTTIDANSSNFTMGYANATLTAEWDLITHSITGNVIWNDQANKYESRPENVNVTLNSDEEITEEGALQTPNTKQVTEGNYSFEKLQTKKTKDNTNYQYSVSQNKVAGYETVVDGYNITNNLILPKYTSQITMRPLNSFSNKLLKNGQAKIVGIVTADSNNINKVGAYDEEVSFQIDSGVEIAEDSIKVHYIDKEGKEEELKNYTLKDNELKVNFESNKTSHITAGDSLRIELNGTLKELKQYVSRISYSGFLRDYETGENTDINLGTLTVATNDISEEAGSIVEEQLPEANIQIKKVDSITEEKLTDATFTLYEWNGNKYVEKEIIQDIDKDGIYTSKAYRWKPSTEGKYRIVETGVPANHKNAKFSMEYTLDQIKAENYTIEVDYNNPNYIINYENEPDDLNQTKGIVENEPYKVKAGITKVDKETGRVIEAEGIFTIYEWDKDTESYKEYVSYINGNKVTMERQEDKTYLSSEWLYYTPKNEGKYRIVETQAPEGYYPEYDNNNEKKAYDINLLTEIENGTHTNEETIKIESEEGKGVLENTRVSAELKVSVIDRETKQNIGQADATLEGAEYGLYAKEDMYHADGTSLLYRKDELVMARKTDKEAKMTFENLECGTYYLKMIEPSEGYVKEETRHEINLSYQGENTEKVVLEKTVDSQVIKQGFELNKQKENGEALENAGFSIYFIRDLSIVKTGKITKVTTNTYQLNDEVAKADKRMQGKENEDETYNLEDLITYYYGRYIGQEENAGTLPGDNEVYYPYDMKNENYVLNYQNNEQGEEIVEIRTNEDGYLKSPDLAYGEYIVVESRVPREQEEVKPFIVKITENNREEAKDIGNVIDKDFKAKVKIYKKDQETNQIILKEKTGYVIRRLDTNELMTTKIWDSTLEDYIEYGTLENPFETEETGYVITPMELKLGEYILEEVKAPEGYSVNGYEGSSKDGEIEWERQEKVRFSINSTTNYYMNNNMEKIMVVNQENKAVVGTIKIKAEGEYLSNVVKDESKETSYQFIYETRPVAGVTYEVYVKEDIYTQDNQGTLLYEKDQFITELTTDENGKAMVENLPLGTYYIKEKETVEGYSKKEEIREVELSYEGQEAPVVFKELPEEKLRQKIEIVIHNKDEETEEKRTGGKYELYTREEIEYLDTTGEKKIIPEDEKLLTLTTNEEGIIDINRDLNVDLPRGKYYLKEIEAPTGYVLQEKELEIDTMQEELVEIIHIEKDFYGIKTKLAIKEINEENEITIGSEFEIRRKDTGEVVESFTTKGKEDRFEKLETNVEYVVVETKAIPGYTTAKEVNFVIKENGKLWIEGEEQEENIIILRDYTTKLNIHLKDIETNEYVEGAVLQIIKKTDKTEENKEEQEEIIAEWKTQEAGQKIYRLAVGEYTIREVKLPEHSGYATIEEKQITVMDTIEEQQVELKQDFTKIRIEIVDGETKEKIDNLEITIIDKESKKEVAKTKGENEPKQENMIRITEMEEGYYLERLPIGDYIIKEKTPEGYKEVEEVEMKVEDTEKLQIVNIENKRLIYDMQVEKELVSITIDGEKKLVPRGELQKVEVKESKIKTADIRLEYVIRVSNVGETRATIGTIIDNIPEGFKLVSTDWKQEGRKAIYNAEKEELKPSESKEIRIVLKWENNETNFGEKKNTAQLKGSTNPYGYEDKTTDNNIGEEITIFSIKTGTQTSIIIIKDIVITLLASIVICMIAIIEITILKRK